MRHLLLSNREWKQVREGKSYCTRVHILKFVTLRISALLHFTYAEVNELAKKYDVVHKMYEKYLAYLLQELEEMETPPESPVNPSSTDDLKNAANGNTADSDIVPSATQPSFLLPAVPEAPASTSEYAERRAEYGLVWIMYMRFAHRAEGLKPSRKVFGNARKIKHSPWEVYEAAGTSSSSSVPQFSQTKTFFSAIGVPCHRRREDGRFPYFRERYEEPREGT
jgi:hypothetical protein